MIESFQHRSKTHRALIRIEQVIGGFIWSVECQRLTGDMTGHGEPLGRPNGTWSPDRFHITRGGALADAAAKARFYIPDREIIDWTRSLTTKKETQGDLFDTTKNDVPACKDDG